MFFCFCMESVLDMFFSFHWFWTPLVFCWVLQFHKNIGMFFRNVSTANLMGTQPSPRWTPGSLNSPGRFRDLGKTSPLSLAESGKSGMSFEIQPDGMRVTDDALWGFWGGGFGNCLHQDDEKFIFLDPEIPPKNLYFSVSRRGGSILSWILPSFFCVLDFDSWSKDPVLWHVILKVWVMNRASKGWCIYYISLKRIVIWSSSSTACH